EELDPDSTSPPFVNPSAWLRGFDRSQVARLEVFGGDEDGFLQQWGRDISLWDEEGWSNSVGWRHLNQIIGDVHIYLVAKLFRALADMKNPWWNANRFLEVGLRGSWVAFCIRIEPPNVTR
ncbi:hypothetical protein N9L68_08460, partial [bacterium]|nr:hypothetical protein [bacterium]